jgi:hypothetical protein
MRTFKKMARKLNKYVRKSLKILAWTVGSIIGLFLLLVLLIQVPAVQNALKNKAVTYLEGKIKTPVRIDRIEIGLPKKVIVEGVYLQGQKGDTLIFGKKIAVDISLFKLLSNEVEVNSVALEGITANVSRDKDSVFNFDYIIKAFDSGKPKDTTSKPMKISFNKISLDKIKIKFNDAVSKNDLQFSLNHFDTKLNKFDLDKLDFDVSEIAMDGLNLKLKQGELVREIGKNTAKVANSLSKNTSFTIRLGEINFTRIAISYDNAGTQLNSGISLNKLRMKFNATDIQKQNIEIAAMEMNGLKGGFTIKKLLKKTTAGTTASTAPNSWKIKLNQADLSDIAFRFDDENSVRIKKGIDYKHLELSNFNLKAERLQYTSAQMSGNIRSFTMRDKSGVDIESLRTDFFYGAKQAYLKDLYLKTPQTLVKDNILLQYPSISALSKTPGELDLNASLDHSHIGFKDVLLFVPALENTNPFKDNPTAIVYINGQLNGKVKDIEIPNMEISGIGNTRIAASGRITGLPDAKNAVYALTIREIHTTAKDINSFIPPGTLPSNIQLPAELTVRGTFGGKSDNLNADVNVTSSFGNAKVKAIFDKRVKNHEKYNADVQLDNFDVGKLIKNDSIGKISLNAKVNGVGLDPRTAVAKLDGKLVKAEFNGYTYRNLNLKGDIRNGKFSATAGMKDPNLTFDMVSSGTFKDKYPSGTLSLNVDIADLDKLNLHAGPMKLRGKVEADIASSNPDRPNGTISAYHFVIANEKEQFQLDSINVVAESTADSTKIGIKSQFLKAQLNGKYQLTKVGAALSNTVAKFYNTKANAEARKEDVTPQSFDFKVAVNDDPVLMKLVPQLTRFEPVNIEGGYNSAKDSLVVKGTIPRVVYGANTVSGVVVDIHTEKDSLVYNINIDEVENAQFKLPDTNLSGSLKNNIATYNLNVRDEKGKEHYLIAGNMKADNGTTEIHLNPDGLILNYDPWNIAADNLIRLGSNGIYANNFQMEREGSSIKLQSQSDEANAPLKAEFTNFKIETISKMVQKPGKEGLAVGGTINGDALFKNLTTNPVFTSDLKIENFSVSKDTVGNISIKVDNSVANTYSAKVGITGNDNQVDLDGNYRSDTKSFDLDLDIKQLQLKSIQGFTMGNMTKSSGFLSGKLKVTGTSDAPDINGDIVFNEAKFNVTQLNSAFTISDEKITFSKEGIRFDKFSLIDSENNTLTLDGMLLTQNYRDFGFDLKLRADNFRAVNSSAKDNELFYGKLFLDTRLNIKGDLNKPVVDGSLKINDDTDFTIVLPQADPGIADREGIVEFIDQDNPQLTKKLIQAKDSLATSKFKGMNVNVNIEISKQAQLTMVIDKGNGDFIKLKGEARLNGGIDESGKTSLTGRYELSEGSYEMSFNLIKRKFAIDKDSYILWTGEPTSANISITATYVAKTAPIDLLDNQLGQVSESIRNTYKQRLPFETKLKMNGELLKPEITFDIVLPDGNYGVSSDIVDASQKKLEQLRQEPAELNKQVFALLLLNRFIGENPFSSEAGGTSAESMARQSVSKILSQQLNNLAGDLINGIELNFDLESTDDYTSGERQNRTDLNVGISKKLLNDRLKVTVGSSFGLEGAQQANEETNNIAGDVQVDYQLTRDGRYAVRAYRKNEYEVELQGQVIETGVGFIITMDYNVFSELFHRSKEERKMIKEEKEAKAKKKAADAKKKAEKDSKDGKKTDIKTKDTDDNDD